MKHTGPTSLTSLSTLETPSVIMMVGVPGSGKSYIGNQVGNIMKLPLLSSDSIRKELSGDENNQEVSQEAWTLLYDRAERYIRDRSSVIIDGTHTVAERRRNDIERYKNYGAKAVVGLHVATHIEIAIRRNNARDRVVPEYVLYDMQANLNVIPPSIEDGFDFVVHLNNDRQAE